MVTKEIGKIKIPLSDEVIGYRILVCVDKYTDVTCTHASSNSTPWPRGPSMVMGN
jgi:hypothetical protein